MLLCGITPLLIRGDVEINLGLKKTKSCYNFFLSHWNLNSFIAHNFSKISLLEAYNAQPKFDMMFINETYLDLHFPDDDPRLTLPGYNLVRPGNSNNTKRSGAFAYFKESLAALWVTSPYLNKCLLLEVFVQIKNVMWFHYKCYLVKPRTSLMIFCLTLSNFSLILSLATLVSF